MSPLPAILLVAGLALFAGAWWAYRRRAHIADTPTSKVRSMAIGAVELKGKAVPPPGRDLLRAPFTDEPCVYWEYKVEEKRTRVSKGKTETYWATVASERSKTPIGLRDDTGVVRVDPQGGDLPTKVEARFGSGFGRDPPEKVLAFLAKKGIQHEGLFGMNKSMRYIESRLPEFTDVYVLGNATRPDEAAGEGNAALVVQREGDGAFMVSTASEEALLRNWSIGFWLMLLAGIGAASAGAYLLGAA